jgi:hypothetical protein
MKFQDWMRSRPRDGGPIPDMSPVREPVTIHVLIRVGDNSENEVATIEADTYEEAKLALPQALHQVAYEVTTPPGG